MIVLVGLVVFGYLGEAQATINTPISRKITPPLDSQIESRTQGTPLELSRLPDLLTPVGISVDESKLIDVTLVQDVRMSHIKWNAYVGAPEFVEPGAPHYPAGRELTVLDRRKIRGPMQRRRFIVLTTHDVFIAAVDRNAQLLWWGQMEDPRTIRSEWPKPTGELTGVTLHRSSPTLYVQVPDDTRIKELSFYSIKWKDGKFFLDLINTVPF
jgi:hypothetical protein